MMKINVITIILLFAAHFLSAQNEAEQLLENVKDEFSKVEDYQVDIHIKVDVDFLKVPETDAKLYFKQPDKIELKSEGFALLPKEGMDFSPTGFIKGNYTAIYEGKTDLNGSKYDVVKIIPSGDKGNIILSTLWINDEKNRIQKVESTTKTNGTFTIDLSYDKDQNYPLPSQMIFSFNVDKMNLPHTITGETAPEEKVEDKSTTTTGRVIISYSDYRINKGIKDEIFKD